MTAEAVLAHSRRRWSFVGRLPVPRGAWLLCPWCGEVPVIRYWQFHLRPEDATVRERCDVSVKCTGCAVVWCHGVAVPPEVWANRPRVGGVRGALMRWSPHDPRIWERVWRRGGYRFG